MVAEEFSQPLLMEPFFAERPWGGTLLRERLDKRAPDGAFIGESWEVSDHPDGRSSISGGPFDKRPFHELLEHHAEELLGTQDAPERFPLLVKFIDARSDLSIQVHPSDEWCRAHNHPDRGKAECWYIMDCVPHASIIVGLKPGTTREVLAEALRRHTVEDVVCRVAIGRGDFVAIPPGTVHAILGGTLLCEIQQSSNTTFRLWDWNRRPARLLHEEESLSCTDFAAPPLRHLRLGTRVGLHGVEERTLIRNAYFQVVCVDVPPDGRALLRSPAGRRGSRILNIVEGGGLFEGGDALHRGTTWMLPASLDAAVPIVAGPEGLRVLVTRSLEL